MLQPVELFQQLVNLTFLASPGKSSDLSRKMFTDIPNRTFITSNPRCPPVGNELTYRLLCIGVIVLLLQHLHWLTQLSTCYDHTLDVDASLLCPFTNLSVPDVE